MSLVSTKILLDDAYANGYAIGAFGAHNLEIMKAIIQGAETVGMPVIFQTTGSTYRYIGLKNVVAMANALAEQSKVPIALQLDHGANYKEIIECIRAGYSSVMIDGSHLPLEENIALVKKVVEVAHNVNIAVEAELGAIGGVEEELTVDEAHARFTNPDEAKIFLQETNIDYFAPSFGTLHGNYKTKPNLQFDLLQEISANNKIPLVMHGASEVPDADVKKAISCGVAKVNFSTELKDLFAEQVRDYFVHHPNENDPRKYFVQAREAVAQLVAHKVQLLAGK